MTCTDLAPASQPDRPEVDWATDPANDAAQLYADHPPAVAGAAVATLYQARESEQAMTTEVLAAIPAEARPHGLAFRMKSPASLARKINTKMLEKGTPPDETAGRLTDLVRYTAVTESADRLTSTARRTVQSLKRAGWTMVEAEHSYVAGNPYKGVHVLMASPSGQTAELQFHTEQTQALKDDYHADFEIARDDDVSEQQRDAAYRRMVAAWSQIDEPDKLPRTLGGLPVQTKDYTGDDKTSKQEGRRS